MSLKPCPFCGSVDVELLNVIPGHCVTCFRCHASGPSRREVTDTHAAWNTRTPETESADSKETPHV